MFSKACNLKRHLESVAVYLKEDTQPVKCPNCFFCSTEKRRDTRSLFKCKDAKHFQNLLPRPQLAAGMLASNVFDFLALPSGRVSQL